MELLIGVVWKAKRKSFTRVNKVLINKENTVNTDLNNENIVCPKCNSKNISKDIFFKSSKKVLTKVLPLTFFVLYILFFIIFGDSLIITLFFNYILLAIPLLLIMYFKKGKNKCNDCNNIFI